MLGPTWAVLVLLSHTMAYTDTEDFLSDLDKPGECNITIENRLQINIIFVGCLFFTYTKVYLIYMLS